MIRVARIIVKYDWENKPSPVLHLAFALSSRSILRECPFLTPLSFHVYRILYHLQTCHTVIVVLMYYVIPFLRKGNSGSTYIPTTKENERQ